MWEKEETDTYFTVCSVMRTLRPFHLWHDLRGALLIQGPPGIVVHLPTGPPDIEHVFFPQGGVFVEYRNNGPF